MYLLINILKKIINQYLACTLPNHRAQILQYKRTACYSPMYIVMYWLFKKNKIPCWIMLTSWVSLPVVISLSSSVLPSQSLSTRSPLKPKVLLHFWNKHTRESLHYLPLNFYIAKIFVWKLSLCTKFESL